MQPLLKCDGFVASGFPVPHGRLEVILVDAQAVLHLVRWQFCEIGREFGHRQRLFPPEVQSEVLGACLSSSVKIDALGQNAPERAQPESGVVDGKRTNPWNLITIFADSSSDSLVQRTEMIKIPAVKREKWFFQLRHRWLSDSPLMRMKRPVVPLRARRAFDRAIPGAAGPVVREVFLEILSTAADVGRYDVGEGFELALCLVAAASAAFSMSACLRHCVVPFADPAPSVATRVSAWRGASRDVGTSQPD